MYGSVDTNYALFLKRRVAYGTNETIRFINDIYDRIWTPMPGGNGLIPISSDALLINNNGGDNPPYDVLKNAITTSNVSEFIQLGTGFPPFEVPVYINMYFSEVTQLDSTQKRSFALFKGKEALSTPISPPYGNFTEWSLSNVTVSANTTFLLVPTPDSTLPPLINAMEVFFISDPLTNGTHSKDLDGLGSLLSAFNPLQDWAGDPCLPAPYSWDWLNCSYHDTPRVTSLYLSSFDLSGPLPDFSTMDSLETIYLRNNSLTGPIPDFLATFPNLKQLNLANNQFSGPIPASLSNKNGLNLVVTGNPDLCISGNSCQSRSPSGSSNPTGGRPIAGATKKRKNSSSKLPLILGTTIPAFILIWAIVGILAILHQNNKRKTAAVAVANPGQTVGGNMSPMPLLNPQMMGKVGGVAMNEIKVDMNEHVTDQRAQ